MKRRKPLSPTLKPLRPIRVEGDVAYVPLTRGYEAVIDATDVPLVQDCNWVVTSPTRSTVYAWAFFVDAEGVKSSLRMHRLFLSPEDSEVIDHIDGNGLNNRRNNIRICSVTENNWNTKVSRANRSGYAGVHWDRRKGKWRASIGFKGKDIHLGRFKDPMKAHEAYLRALAEYRGSFSPLLRPED